MPPPAPWASSAGWSMRCPDPHLPTPRSWGLPLPSAWTPLTTARGYTSPIPAALMRGQTSGSGLTQLEEGTGKSGAQWGHQLVGTWGGSVLPAPGEGPAWLGPRAAAGARTPSRCTTFLSPSYFNSGSWSPRPDVLLSAPPHAHIQAGQKPVQSCSMCPSSRSVAAWLVL